MDAASVHSSQADVWYLKEIAFGKRRRIKIITQNFNGPCSFIAICNILVLRDHIAILPPDRTTVSYEFLSQLVGEYLLTNCPDIDISAALSILPSTTKGLDLNPQFTHIDAFSPAAGELALFAQAGIQLVHGWLVDPDSPEAGVMAHVGDYDTAVTLIADADYLTKGRLLGEGEEEDGERDRYVAEPEAVAGPSSGGMADPKPTGAGTSTLAVRRNTTHYSDPDRHKIEHAIVAQQFLEATKSQLTYHGLFQLASTLEPGSLVALYRNAHLSVVYKSHGDAGSDGDTIPGTSTGSNPTNVTPSPSHAHDPALYALVTDDVFLHEPSIVWERLEDVDGQASSFVDSDFYRAVPVGGDVAGAWRGANTEFGLGVVDPADQALARQMQAEEDARARELYQRRHQAQALEGRRARDSQGEAERQGRKRERERKNKNCVVM